MRITRRQLRSLIIEQINLMTEEVTLRDLDRHQTTLSGTPYPKVGAVVVLGKDNPGLFDRSNDKFYKDEERPVEGEFSEKKVKVRVLKEPNTFKKQDDSSIKGNVIDYLKDKDAVIVVPVE